MSTLADELLNDFEDSGSEGEGQQKNGFLNDSPHSPLSNLFNGHRQNSAPNASAGVMVQDVDEEDDDEDEEMSNGDALASDALDNAEDEEEAKAKVEKMQLGGVNDVRNVAGLMKTLEPVLEVGLPLQPLSALREAQGLHLLRKTALTFSSPPENRTISSSAPR